MMNVSKLLHVWKLGLGLIKHFTQTFLFEYFHRIYFHTCNFVRIIKDKIVTHIDRDVLNLSPRIKCKAFAEDYTANANKSCLYQVVWAWIEKPSYFCCSLKHGDELVPEKDGRLQVGCWDVMLAHQEGVWTCLSRAWEPTPGSSINSSQQWTSQRLSSLPQKCTPAPISDPIRAVATQPRTVGGYL